MMSEVYEKLSKILDERLKNDSRLKRIAEKIRNKTADFSDTFEYSQIVSKHLSDVLQENVGQITNPLGKELVCKELLRRQYDSINDVLGKVQVIVDEALRIRIKARKAKFPEKRVEKVAHSLEDPTVPVETIKRRAGAPVENVSNSFHDDYIKENASFRNDAGLQTYIVRTTDGKCCEWCTRMAGTYIYGEEPEDVYRRHDNCDCKILYENEKESYYINNYKKQKKKNKSWQKTPDIPKKEPQRISKDEAKKLEDKHRPKVLPKDVADAKEKAVLSRFRGLTDKRESDTIKETEVRPITLVADSAIENIPNIIIDGYTEEQCKFIQSQHCELLEFAREKNDSKEVAFVFDGNLNNRKEFLGTDDSLDFGSSLFENNSVVMHNHPRNSSFSDRDIRFIIDNENVKVLTIVKNNGHIETLTKTDTYNMETAKTELARCFKKRVKQGSASEIDKAINDFLKSEKGGFEWKTI